MLTRPSEEETTAGGSTLLPLCLGAIRFFSVAKFIEKYTELLLNYELLNLLGKGFAAASLPRLEKYVRLSAQMVVFTFI